ncbi:TAXI family TRAP transporter solute-binding subunit [Effusibacillus consociatus]|uniref:TAXI family TRAP transporter solute-binding subunit n=1 Tax=Effusibacillus consociatus TaxID=1117041 RepID=A0ABV9Q1D7_9BACL
MLFANTRGGDAGKSVKGEVVNVATGTTGGVYYPLGNATAQLWSDKLGVKGSATSTPASQKNIELLEKKEAEIGFSQNNIVVQAYKGEGQFKGRQQKDLRAMTYLYPNVMHFVVRGDSGIKSIKDLEGKKIVPGAVGSGTEISTKEMIGEYGLDYTTKKNVKADFVGFSEAAELMKNKQADAAMIFGGLPTAAILDMATSFNVKLLSFEPEMIKKITEKYPWYFEYVIPANTYKGQTEEIHTLAVANILLVRKDLNDGLVYELTKTLYENTDRLVNAHEIAKFIKLDTALNGLTIPLHPGAEKFYKEKGLDTSKVPKAN